MEFCVVLDAVWALTEWMVEGVVLVWWERWMGCVGCSGVKWWRGCLWFGCCGWWVVVNMEVLGRLAVLGVVWEFGGLVVWWFGGLVVWWFGDLVVWWWSMVWWSMGVVGGFMVVFHGGWSLVFWVGVLVQGVGQCLGGMAGGGGGVVCHGLWWILG